MIAELYEKFDEGDDEAVAAAVLDHLAVDGVARDELLPVVKNDVQWWRRKRVLKIERDGETTQKPDSKLAASTAASNPLLRDKLLKQSFAIGDGRMVMWGEATVADHIARVQFLSAMVDGLRETAGKHQLAVSLIENTPRAKCLNDVAKRKAAA